MKRKWISLAVLLLAAVMLVSLAFAESAPSGEEIQKGRERLEKKKEPEDILAETENALFLYRKQEKRGSSLLSKYDRQQNEKQEDRYVITGIWPLSDSLIIPASLDGIPISGIESKAIRFGGENKVTSLRIAEGITSVQGFRNMKNLKEVYLPDSLQTLGMHAFANDESLTEIRIPDSLTLDRIELQAFYGVGADSIVLADGTDLMAVSLAAYRAEGKGAHGIVFACAGDDLVYLVREDGGAVVLEYTGSVPEDGRLEIPAAVNGHPVREIGERACAYKPALTALVLPEGLESVGKQAFYSCEAMAEVTLPATLKEIGDQAFVGVAAERIDLPEGTRTASSGWFGGLEKTDATGLWTYRILADGTAALTDYAYTEKTVFPAEVDGIPVTEIDDAKYSQESSEKKRGVREIVIPKGVKVLGEEAFANMTSLTKATLPEGLELIGVRAFYNCHSMASVTVPEGVTVIGKSAFESCQDLKTVKLPSTLQEIRTEAFSFCPLSSVKLPDSLRVIGDRAFYNHKASEWTIPAGVESVGDEALLPQFVAQKKITFLGADTMIGNALFGGDENGSWYRDVSSSLYNGLSVTCYPGSTADRWFRSSVKKTYLKWGPEGVRTAPADRVLSAGLFRPDEKVYELTIPEGVEEIADGAFDGLSSLYKVTLPSTLKTIGNRAFADCVGLTEITLPKSLTSIGEECFRNCYSLKKISIPEGVRIIPAYAFAGCESLSDLKLAEGLEEIGVHAFEQDTKAVQNQYWWARGNPTVTSLKTLKLPASLKTIGEYAFVSCDALTTVSFAKASQLTEIGRQAFAMCVLLKDITLPDSVQRVGSAAFVNCLNLKKADLGKGVTGVGEELFLQCMNLMSLKVPESLTDIGGKLLDGCPVKLVVTCPAGSAMDAYMQEHYPDLKVSRK